MILLSEATALLRLQEIDLTLLRQKKVADELPQRAKIVAARTAAKKVSSELSNISFERKDLEIDINDLGERKTMLEGKVQEVHEQAPGSADYRSVQDIELSLSSLAKKLEKVDYDTEHALERLEKVEAAEKNAKALLARIYAEEAALTEAYKAAIADIEALVKKLASERAQIVSSLPKAEVDAYEKARNRFGGLAVETLVGNRPSACRVALQPSSFSDIRRSGSEVTTCPYCHRILIVSKED